MTNKYEQSTPALACFYRRSTRFSLLGVLLMTSLVATVSCGDNDVDLESTQDDSVANVQQFIHKDGRMRTQTCSIQTGPESGPPRTVELEEYVANVVACENPAASFEALKAQAIAARSFAKANYSEKKHGRGTRYIIDSEAGQVSTCEGRVDKTDLSPNSQWSLIKRAVAETAGQVLVHPSSDVVLTAFFVKGWCDYDDQCNPVGYVEGKGGGCFKNRQGLVTPNNKNGKWSKQGSRHNESNRGTMSQLGSTCLNEKLGWKHRRILRYYYGDATRIQKLQTCDNAGAGLGWVNGQPPVSSDSSYTPPPAIVDTPPTFTGDSSSPAQPEICSTNSGQKPYVHTRSEWDAKPAKLCKDGYPEPCVGQMGAITRISIHHTAGKTSANPAEVKQLLRNIQHSHKTRKEDPFADIGYHFLIDLDGGIWEGRKIEWQGAHVEKENPHNVGIALMGRFHERDKPSDAQPITKINEKQMQSVVSLVRWIAKSYNIEISEATVKGHRQWKTASTECPGEYLLPELPKIRELAKADTVCQSAADPNQELNPGTGSESGNGNGNGSGNPAANDPILRTKGLRYVKATGLTESALIDTVKFEANGKTIYASGGSAAPKGVGKPDVTDSCEQVKSNTVELKPGKSIIWEFSTPFLPTDSLSFVRDVLPPSKVCSFPSGTFDVYVSEDGSNWIQIGSQVSGAPNYSPIKPVQGEFPDFGNGGISAGGPGQGFSLGGSLGSILGGLNFPIPGLSSIPGIIGAVGSKIIGIFENITIGKDFNFSFDLSEKAASLEFYVNGELVKVSYDKENGFGFKADFAKILGLNEVVAVVKDAAGKVIDSVKTVLNFSNDSFGFISPQDGALYGPDLTLSVAINDPKVKTVRYEIDGYALPKGSSTDAENHFPVKYTIKHPGTSEKPRVATVVAHALDDTGAILSSASIKVRVAPNAKGLAITQPKPGSTVGSHVRLTVDANDPTISKVQYLVDGKRVAESENRTAAFLGAAKLEYDTCKNVTLTAVGFDASGKEIAKQSYDITVASKNGASNCDRPNNDHREPEVTTPSNKLNELNQLLVTEAQKAWEAGNTCSGYGKSGWARTTPSGNSIRDGHPRCPSGYCNRSIHYCYAYVKGALTRGKVGGVSGQSCSVSTRTTPTLLYNLYGSHGSAKDFLATYEKNPEAFENTLGFRLVPKSKVASPRDAKPGSIILWKPGAKYHSMTRFVDSSFDSTHGHIEIAVGNSIGCSDYCGPIAKSLDDRWYVFERVSAE